MKTIVINRYKKHPTDRKCTNIGRPGPFGNPHAVGHCSQCKTWHTREEAIELFRQYFKERIKEPHYLAMIEFLKGHALVCYCAPKACHGDVIAEYLNSQN